jgi:hypothetical protein
VRSLLLLFSLIFITVFSTTQSWAWGNRGHATICEAAIFLMHKNQLRNSLREKPAMMAHLCNIPDTYWRGLGSDISHLGNPTHFTDVEILGIPTENIPLDYKQVISNFTGKKNAFKEGNIYSIPTEFGSDWWRADQFYRRAVADGKKMKAAKTPEGKNPEQNDKTEFNKAAFAMAENLGLLGHFVGDDSQPFHSTADYDGYGTGHGGIHSYYEDGVVAAQDGDLLSKVIHRGEELQKKTSSEAAFLNGKTVLEKMRALAVVSRKDIPHIYGMDPVLKKSTENEHKGFFDRKPAKRQPAATVANRYQPILVTELARGAVLLAQLWDQAYEDAGSPDFQAYRSYKYPFTPDFVAPDYFDLKK